MCVQQQYKCPAPHSEGFEIQTTSLDTEVFLEEIDNKVQVYGCFVVVVFHTIGNQHTAQFISRFIGLV